MARKKKIQASDGSMVDATVLNFQTGGEHWNEYLADDGTLVRAKLVATEILRVDGHYDAEGNPIYLLQSTNVLSVQVPDDLKRKEDQS